MRNLMLIASLIATLPSTPTSSAEVKPSVSYTQLGRMKITSYRSVPEQTDNSPFITSIGWRTNKAICAVSQDLLRSGRVKYGDVLLIPNVGLRTVADTMHPRHRNAVDVWVETKKEESHIGVRKENVLVVRT